MQAGLQVPYWLLGSTHEPAVHRHHLPLPCMHVVLASLHLACHNTE
jgi:hypothetical protein